MRYIKTLEQKNALSGSTSHSSNEVKNLLLVKMLYKRSGANFESAD